PRPPPTPPQAKPNPAKSREPNVSWPCGWRNEIYQWQDSLYKLLNSSSLPLHQAATVGHGRSGEPSLLPQEANRGLETLFPQPLQTQGSRGHVLEAGEAAFLPGSHPSYSRFRCARQL